MHHLSDYFVILATKTICIMRNSLIITLIAGVSVMLGMVSCSKNVYNEDTHRELIHYYSAVDSVDQQHMWMLTEYKSLRYQVPSGGSYKQLRIYSANPLSNSKAELMNQIYVSAGKSGVLSVDVPYQVTTLYAALADESGNLTVTSFPSTQVSFDFSDAVTGKALSSLKPQTYTYLFEENYPEPGDYDYNDVVIRVSQQRTAVNQITVNVTISAVGATKQIAGCIRLVGYKYDDVDSVYTTTGASFNDGINDQTLYPFGNLYSDKTVAHSLLMKGQNQEAVLNLFCDAHWAMAFNVDADYGLFTRKKYNVMDPNSESYDTNTYQSRSTRTLSYVITFKEDNQNVIQSLDNFTLNAIDPFIVTYYNGGNWETHVEQFKSAKVLANYAVASFKDLPWALMVPQSDFRYPLEGTEIGYRKKLDTGITVMMGAYTTSGHSFGEWAEDHTRFLDWYLYPNTQMTY